MDIDDTDLHANRVGNVARDFQKCLWQYKNVNCFMQPSYFQSTQTLARPEMIEIQIEFKLN